MKSNFFLSFLRALKLPLKLLVAWLGKSKNRAKFKREYEPKFSKNERRIESWNSKKKKGGKKSARRVAANS